LRVSNEVVFLGMGTSGKDQERRQAQQRGAEFQPRTRQRALQREKVILKMKLKFNFKINCSVKHGLCWGQGPASQNDEKITIPDHAIFLATLSKHKRLILKEIPA